MLYNKQNTKMDKQLQNIDSHINVLAIIACGAGTRMSLFTGNNYIPKLLLNVGGKTILAKILESTLGHGIDKVVIALGTEQHIRMCKQHVKENFAPEVRNAIDWLLHDKLDGSAGACSAVISHIEASSWFDKEYRIMFHWSDIYAPMLPKMLYAMFENIEDGESFINCATRYADSNEHLYIQPIDNATIINRNQVEMCVRRAKFNKDEVLSKSIFGIYSMHSDTAAKFYQVWTDKFQDAIVDATTVFNEMHHQDNDIEICWCKFDQWPEDDMQIEIYGDTASYFAACAKHMKEKEVRYFNDMCYTEDTCIKTSLVERGHKLLENEKKWYEFVSKCGIESVPKVFEMSEHSFTMERIKGVTVKEYIDKFDKQYKCNALAYGLLQMFHEQIEQPLQAIVSYGDDVIPKPSTEVKLKAMMKEYVDTNTSRYYEVNELVRDIWYFNNVPLVDFESLMSRLAVYIEDTAKDTKFAFLHGDPHTGNVMIGEHGLKLYAIDPRGYFGEGQYNKVGDADYDIAKFAFGLNGNTNFARMSQHILKSVKCDGDGLNIQANIEGYDLDALPLTTRQKLLVALCWIKFPAWLKNNPAEAIITYCYGNVMTNKYLKELGY